MVKRHTSTIRLGRSLWQTPALLARETSEIKQRSFPEGTFPNRPKCRKALDTIRKQDEERPIPFAGVTEAYATYTTLDYGARLEEWLQKLACEAETPNVEQLQVLHGIRDRILVECRVVKEGGLLCSRMQPEDTNAQMLTVKSLKVRSCLYYF